MRRPARDKIGRKAKGRVAAGIRAVEVKNTSPWPRGQALKVPRQANSNTIMACGAGPTTKIGLVQAEGSEGMVLSVGLSCPWLWSMLWQSMNHRNRGSPKQGRDNVKRVEARVVIGKGDHWEE